MALHGLRVSHGGCYLIQAGPQHIRRVPQPVQSFYPPSAHVLSGAQCGGYNPEAVSNLPLVEVAGPGEGQMPSSAS